MKKERKKASKFREAFKHCFPDAFYIDYPDSGGPVSKKKPPDFICQYDCNLFVIEWKVPGGALAEHQYKDLKQASYTGAFAFVGTIHNNNSITFEEIRSGSTYFLEYNKEYKDLKYLPKNLKALRWYE